MGEQGGGGGGSKGLGLQECCRRLLTPELLTEYTQDVSHGIVRLGLGFRGLGLGCRVGGSGFEGGFRVGDGV